MVIICSLKPINMIAKSGNGILGYQGHQEYNATYNSHGDEFDNKFRKIVPRCYHLEQFSEGRISRNDFFFFHYVQLMLLNTMLNCRNSANAGQIRRFLRLNHVRLIEIRLHNFSNLVSFSNVMIPDLSIIYSIKCV